MRDDEQPEPGRAGPVNDGGDPSCAAPATARGRPIRSFVRRGGRLTPSQASALSDLMPRYGIAPSTKPIDPAQHFGRHAPLVMEIGFGNGDALVWMAQQQPEYCFLGVEVHRPGLGHALKQIDAAGLSNVRVLEDDAVTILQQRIAPASLRGLRIYFPDPWHKKRHNKRRLIQQSFLELAIPRLELGGVLHLATDWEPYAEQMRQLCEQQTELENQVGPGKLAQRPFWRPQTRFERRGLRLGHGVWDLLYRRRSTS